LRGAATLSRHTNKSASRDAYHCAWSIPRAFRH
jgi:hypothetical protein